jgi:cyclopropane fatty-acyl-phospholipid synthase-like methyltransferase
VASGEVQVNLESYDAIAALWDQQRVRLSPAEARILPMVTRGLAPGARVLDLGCGTGHPVATHFATAGFRITGIDQSPAMLAFAQQRLPTHQWLLGSIEDFPPVEQVTAAVAWDSLFHIPRDRHAHILARVRSTLPEGGRFALTAGGSDHPAFIDTMFDRHFFYDSYPPHETALLLEATGFKVVLEEYLNRPDGARDKGRVAFVAVAA